ncbi:hypothetical protein P7K49_014830 [Saguinus oedipus]|uniref:FAM171 N-terminal domain-containing protein n=1 Tax=Saguinus oedipus TaxID=9490 RepID=A0ABQ9V7T4_SAGOE|nr:hypothetical protein P7K49_014830 [Saguinus oedipus]
MGQNQVSLPSDPFAKPCLHTALSEAQTNCWRSDPSCGMGRRGCQALTGARPLPPAPVCSWHVSRGVAASGDITKGTWLKSGLGLVHQEGSQLTWTYIAPQLGYWVAAMSPPIPAAIENSSSKAHRDQQDLLPNSSNSCGLLKAHMQGRALHRDASGKSPLGAKRLVEHFHKGLNANQLLYI